GGVAGHRRGAGGGRKEGRQHENEARQQAANGPPGTAENEHVLQPPNQPSWERSHHTEAWDRPQSGIRLLPFSPSAPARVETLPPPCRSAGTGHGRRGPPRQVVAEPRRPNGR